MIQRVRMSVEYKAEIALPSPPPNGNASDSTHNTTAQEIINNSSTIITTQALLTSTNEHIHKDTSDLKIHVRPQNLLGETCARRPSLPGQTRAADPRAEGNPLGQPPRGRSPECGEASDSCIRGRTNRQPLRPTGPGPLAVYRANGGVGQKEAARRSDQ